MSVGERFERLIAAATRRPVATVLIVAVLAAAGGLLALSLRPSAGIDTFVSPSSASYRATVDDQRHFGQDAVIVLIHESLPDLVQTKDLATLTELEACFAGQYAVPSASLRAFTFTSAHAAYGGPNSPCAKLKRYQPALVVYGPGTFLNRAVAAVNTEITTMLAGVGTAVRNAEAAAYQLALGRHLSAMRAKAAAAAAGKLEQQQQYQSLEQMALTSGITSLPSIDSPQFIPEVVYDQTRGVNQPKSRFAYLFPNKNSALIQIRLKASLSDEQQARAIGWIRQAIAMPQFRSAYGGRYTVSGVPVVLHDLSSTISGSIARMLVAVLIVMALALLVVFRSRLRLLPLVLALAGAGITFGLLAALGAPLTLASVAVLPILIGLGVDYGIQFQARAQEARAEDGAAGGAQAAVARAAGRAAPTIATAALATATGFLVLLLSPVPMVQGFGLLLVAGIAVALVVALTAGSAALVLGDRGGGPVGASVRGAAEILRPAGQALGGAGAALAAAARGAGELLGAAGRRLTGRGSRAPAGRWQRRRRRGDRGTGIIAAVAAHPGRVLALAAVLALGGWVADTQTSVQSDVTKLVPSSMPALRHLRTLEKVTGVSGEIDVTVRGRDVATPAVVGWMIRYENQLLSHYGYLETRGCAYSTLCPALSLPDLFSTSSQATKTSAGLTQSAIDQLLSAVPTYFSQAVITPDHREATLAFGIRLMPLARQQRVLDYMRSQLHPPPGIQAALAGLPVLAAQADQALSSSGHRLLTLLIGLIAVALVLAVVFRALGRAIVPMVPIALATGWSALILYLIGIPLNPMSATLGALVIAISTEFSVLLSERFRQERAAGHDLSTALERTYRSTGIAVVASGVTAIVGFGVLVFSDITMLRDFGFVTFIDLVVSLGGVLLVLPAVLVLSERGDLPDAVRAVAGPAAARFGRLRRRPTVA
ncbi:MAG TPA: MMPL family transporter [Solirubrobacteraceae bacterium]|nr:MMPL family transporter [Solirubrobacteraceae bacterium]